MPKVALLQLAALSNFNASPLHGKIGTSATNSEAGNNGKFTHTSLVRDSSCCVARVSFHAVSLA